MTPVPPSSQPKNLGGGSQRFGGLFDTSFSTFITPSIVRTIYTLALLAALAAAVVGIFVGVVFGLFGGSVGEGLVNIIFVPIVALVLLVLVRLSLELTMVVFSIADNLKAVRLLGESGRPPSPPHLPSK